MAKKTDSPPFVKTEALEAVAFPPLTGISTADDRAGVEGGNQKGGPGLVGTSKAGVGIFGKGGTLAGQFEGNVEVEGNADIKGALAVGGVDIVSLVHRILESQQHERNPQGPFSVDVSFDRSNPGTATFTMFGKGLGSGKRIDIVVKKANETLGSSTVANTSINADGSGNVTFTQTLPTDGRTTYTFQATYTPELPRSSRARPQPRTESISVIC